ncbi:MAG: hypothetical protein IK097_04325 [Clostridia bacterium]|nr:hypothetical protein [Clostridia bacterium]
MKRSFKAILCIVLALSLVIGGFSAVGAGAASDIGDKLTHVGVSLLEGIIRGVLGGLDLIIPDSSNFKKVSEYSAENFYSGNDEWLNEPADNGSWQLGYAKASLVPDDILDKNKDYYLGGFMTLDNGMNNKVEEVIDDMQIRVIAVDDGSVRGISVYGNVDCIGFCNGDIQLVRKYFKELMPDTEFASVNLSSTHCHSCLDTQGLWTNQFKKIFGNMFKSYLPFLEKEKGVNQEWLDWAAHIMAQAMKAAVDDMTPGTMTYAVKTLNKDYFDNRNRKSCTSLCTDMSRFVFTPSDEGKAPTMIINIAAHPDVTGLATSDPVDNGRQLSGDYVYYLGETVEQGGYNFMFFNGAIAGIYYGRGLSNDGQDLERRYMQAMRYGHEMGNIALNLTNTYDEISANADWETINREKAAGGDNYSLWFEDWEPVEERELEPLFNVKLKTVPILVTNPLMQLVGKLDLVDYQVYKDGINKYYMYSEIGLAQFGDVMVAMMPGEVVQDLVYGGGSLTAEGSFKGKDFGYKTVRELFGEDTIVFGLCNDAIGYVVPDNDYSLGIVDDHYQELISLGEVTASSILKAYAELADEIA